MRNIIKIHNHGNFKITVEEITPFRFIATLWVKDMCLEQDRQVREFETYGGAVDKAFDFISEIAYEFEKKKTHP